MATGLIYDSPSVLVNKWNSTVVGALHALTTKVIFASIIRGTDRLEGDFINSNCET